MTDLLGQARLFVAAAADIGIATAITVHVLLRKRDVAAALGWIGLAWLSPILGGVLYFTFGINRVSRRARKFHGAPRPRLVAGPAPSAPVPDSPLAAAVLRITGRAAQPGTAIAILNNGDAAYPPMLEAIGTAKHSVALTSYILRDDAAGAPFLDALIAAAGRGVAVRVLLDGIGSGYFASRAYARLRAAGVPAARFMHSPLPWRMPFLNLRTHKKILVTDGCLAFTGGMNISAQNLLATAPRHPVRDVHFALRGPVVAQLMEAFASDWAFVTGENLRGAAWFPLLEPAGTAVARVVTSGPDQDNEKIEVLLLQAITCAQQSIQIVTPYFLPNDRLITALALAALRGVTVDIVLPQHGDHRLLDWAARTNMEPLVHGGCRIWRNPPPFDHSKIFLVDGAWCLIGSPNWDVRSLRLNFEIAVEVTDTALAGALAAIVTAGKGLRVTARELTGRALPVKLRDALARLLLPYL